MSSLSTKNKTISLVLILMMAAFTILIGSVYVNQKHKLRNEQMEYYADIKKSYDKILKKHDEFYTNRATANLESSGVKEALYAQDREKLFQLARGRWETLRKANPDLTVMHFHLPNGTSFLRMHDPKHYGDPIALKRPMVAKIHQDHRPLHGFERGEGGLAYRTIVPAVYKGQYIGALEFGAKPNDILREMEYFNDIYGALFIKDDSEWTASDADRSFTIGDYQLQFQTLKNTALLSDLKNKGFDFEDFETRIIKGRTYSVYVFDLHDFKGNVTAKAVFFQDITQLENSFRQTIVDLLLLLLFLSIGMMGVINVGFKRILGVLDLTKDALQRNQDFLQSIFETSKDGIALLDLKTNFLYFNNAYLKMTGFTKEELLTKSCAAMSTPEDYPRALKAVEEVIQKGYLENFEKTCIVKDGKRVMINMSMALMPDRKRLLITTKNITEAKKLERQFKEYVRLVNENVITSTTDLAGNITYVSKAFCVISGFEREELIGKNHRVVRHPDMDKRLYEELWTTITSGNIWEGEIKNKKKDGGFYWVNARIYPIYDDEGQKIGYTAIRQDITDKKRVEEISITDGLTEIYNRRHFNELFSKIVNSAKRHDEMVCLIIMDVDYFKLYNDTYGHLKGDEVLIRVASVLKSSLRRADDYCFRLGGEEFGLIFQADDQEGAFEFADQIRQKIEALGIAHEKNLAAPVVTVSMGMICGQGPRIADGDMLYKEADELLYAAKESGRNRVIAAVC